MLTKINDGNNLGTLQKKIILLLAENGPLTKNEASNRLKASYKPLWLAFDSLRKKNLIKEVGEKEYRGNKFPTYWLNDGGLILALINGANSDRLLEHYRILYGENEHLELLIEMSKAVGQKCMRDIYIMFKASNNNKLALRAIPLNPETSVAFIKVLRKHPSIFNAVKNAFKSIFNEQDVA